MAHKDSKNEGTPYFVSYTHTEGNSFGFANCYIGMQKLDVENMKTLRKTIQKLMPEHKNVVVMCVVRLDDQD